MPGFPEDVPGKTVHVGFMRNAVLTHAEKIIELVKAGKIKHFFLVGGCDGAKPGRNYYTEFVDKSPAGHHHPDPGLRPYRFYDMTWAPSTASRACSTWASATTPTRPSRWRWPWPTPSRWA